VDNGVYVGGINNGVPVAVGMNETDGAQDECHVKDMGVDPWCFICQDLLHSCQKFFWDHPAKWLSHMLSPKGT
jgi:hypothetical protein